MYSAWCVSAGSCDGVRGCSDRYVGDNVPELGGEKRVGLDVENLGGIVAVRDWV